MLPVSLTSNKIFFTKDMGDREKQTDTRRQQTNEIPYSAELSRKALHLIALVVPIGMALLGRMWSIYILVPCALLAVGADVLRVRSVYFANIIDRVFGFMMRGEERPPVGGKVSINGATWILITAASLSITFPVHLAASAFGMFMISDAAAALVGRRIGRIHWGKSTRTVEGTGAFVVTGIVVMLLIPQISPFVGTAGVIAASIAEIPTRPLNDNIRAPFAAAFVMYAVENLTRM